MDLTIFKRGEKGGERGNGTGEEEGSSVQLPPPAPGGRETARALCL